METAHAAWTMFWKVSWNGKEIRLYVWRWSWSVGFFYFLWFCLFLGQEKLEHSDNRAIWKINYLIGQCSEDHRGKGSRPRWRIGLEYILWPGERRWWKKKKRKEVMTGMGPGAFPAWGGCGSHSHGHNYGPHFLLRADEITCWEGRNQILSVELGGVTGLE